ncbi:MAG TPA: hypothetical protein VFV34_18025 [Blastocatellia bacterium]|nr:hypothetical protein [Blastocatellia bacterium]
MLRLFRILTAVLFAIGLLSCSKPAKPEEAEKASVIFFDRLKEADYDRIYDDASKSFRDQNARATAADKLKQIAALGTIHDYTRLSMTLGEEGGQNVVLPVYTVRFDQVRAEVTLKLIDENGNWKLLGFAVRPLTGS